MTSNPKEPEVMQGRQEEENEGGHELCPVQAPSVETTVSHVGRSHSADRTLRSPVGLRFLDKYGKGQIGGRRRTPEPTESLMASRI